MQTFEGRHPLIKRDRIHLWLDRDTPPAIRRELDALRDPYDDLPLMASRFLWALIGGAIGFAVAVAIFVTTQ